MTDAVNLMGAGLRTGASTAVIADCDDLVTFCITDGVGAADAGALWWYGCNLWAPDLAPIVDPRVLKRSAA